MPGEPLRQTPVIGRGLPAPWVRLTRNRPMLLATVLAASVAIAAGAVADAAHVQVTSQVDAHWRGAYDILVRPHDSRLGLEKTAGVVEPNFLGFTGTGGITLDQLAAIRGLADVELAAPVAFIGYITTNASMPTHPHQPVPIKADALPGDLDRRQLRWPRSAAGLSPAGPVPARARPRRAAGSRWR